MFFLIVHNICGIGDYIIFMHGWGGNKDSLACLIEKLSTRYCCISVDFYGFGDTPMPNRVLKLSDYTDSIRELCLHYHTGQVILVGHSFGGRVAIDYASKYANVDKIILIDSAGMKPRFSLIKKSKIVKYKLCKKLNIKQKTVGSKDYRELNNLMRGTFVNIVNTFQEKQLNKIYAKTLIIWGRKDKDTPLYMAKRFNKKLLNSELHVYDGGHFCYLDRTIQIVNDIADFLEA